jgi:hypothetical protein
MAVDPTKLQALQKQNKKDGAKPFGGEGPKPPKGPAEHGGGGGGNPALGMLKNIQGQLAKAIEALEDHEHGEGEDPHEDAVDLDE